MQKKIEQMYSIRKHWSNCQFYSERLHLIRSLLSTKLQISMHLHPFLEISPSMDVCITYHKAFTDMFKVPVYKLANDAEFALQVRMLACLANILI